MALQAGQANVTITTSIETRDRLREIAAARGVSVSEMLRAWLDSGIDAPLVRDGKRQAVRAYKDELMISLPRDWQRRVGIEKGDRIRVAYSDDALIIHR